MSKKDLKPEKAGSEKRAVAERQEAEDAVKRNMERLTGAAARARGSEGKLGQCKYLRGSNTYRWASQQNGPSRWK